MATIGIICDQTCLSFAPGDDTPFPGLGNVMGQPFTLVQNATSWSLTIEGTTFDVPLNSITLADPALGYAAGTLQYFQTLVNDPAGFAFVQEYLCPAVPEPSTLILLAVGLVVGSILSPLGCLAGIKRDLRKMSCR